MTPYQMFDLPVLVEILAKYTVSYTQMLTDSSKTDQEFLYLKDQISLIQEAIKGIQNFGRNRNYEVKYNFVF